MRIIAGSARGLRLAPVPAGVRPVSDRAREGLFSSLGERVLDAEVLDLYAGTGALGIEALSRGASSAVFVESDLRAARAVGENLRTTGLAETATVRRRAVLAFLRGSELHRAEGPALAFLDPPYAIPESEVESALSLLGERWAGVGPWTVALTRPARNDTIVIPVNWQAARRLVYGESLVILYQEV
jgi:16S rRNA (guanine966-N2)-methyltransferase